jgi:hypothetical protein
MVDDLQLMSKSFRRIQFPRILNRIIFFSPYLLLSPILDYQDPSFTLLNRTGELIPKIKIKERPKISVFKMNEDSTT